jgi:hypothetical protein
VGVEVWAAVRKSSAFRAVMTPRVNSVPRGRFGGKVTIESATLPFIDVKVCKPVNVFAWRIFARFTAVGRSFPGIGRLFRKVVESEVDRPAFSKQRSRGTRATRITATACGVFRIAPRCGMAVAGNLRVMALYSLL